MSIKVMTAVWPLRLPALDKLVLLALADNANDEGECYPSISTLIAKCGMSRRALLYSLDRLESARYVSRLKSLGLRNVYHVHPCTTDTSAPHAPVHVMHDTSAPHAPTEKKKTSSLEPSVNRQAPPRQARKPKPEAVDEPLPSNLNVEAWHRWEQYRRQIRKPIHSASWLSAQRKLAAFGADQEPVVEQSIANGWQGLFALKDRPKQEEPRRGLPTLRV